MKWLGLVIQGIRDSFHDIEGIAVLISPASSMNRVAIPYFLESRSGRTGRSVYSGLPDRGLEKSLETERFGTGRVDDFPDINTHSIVENLELVDQGDVDRPVGVFKDLAGFCNFEARHCYDFNNDLIVKQKRPARGSAGSIPPTTLGIVGAAYSRVSWIFSFRAVSQEKIGSGMEPGCFEEGKNNLTCGPGISGALEYDELSGP